MKKLLTAIAVILVATNISFADTKVAVVDVNAIVSNSSQVKALKNEQQAKLKDLDNWLKTVRADIEKQSTKENKEKLVKKYDAEFAKKQKAIKENYAKKLEEIDKNINQKIEEKAKADNIDIILVKNTVLYGGTDITKDLIKAIK